MTLQLSFSCGRFQIPQGPTFEDECSPLRLKALIRVLAEISSVEAIRNCRDIFARRGLRQLRKFVHAPETLAVRVKFRFAEALSRSGF